MKVLFEDDFRKFKPGPLPCDFSATGECHYLRPRRYPHYNASNYRAEISLPDWEEM